MERKYLKCIYKYNVHKKMGRRRQRLKRINPNPNRFNVKLFSSTLLDSRGVGKVDPCFSPHHRPSKPIKRNQTKSSFGSQVNPSWKYGLAGVVGRLPAGRLAQSSVWSSGHFSFPPLSCNTDRLGLLELEKGKIRCCSSVQCSSQGLLIAQLAGRECNTGDQ